MARNKKMSLQTRLKISEGVKASHQRKLDESFAATSKSTRLMHKLGEAFAEGHPDHLSVAAVRNYGGFGIERRVVVSEDRQPAHLPTHEEKPKVEEG